MNISGVENSGLQSPEAIYRDLQKETAESRVNPESGKEKEREWSIKDEYIPEDKKSPNPAGIYEKIQDEDGRPKIQYVDSGREKKAVKSCIGNTDQMDREIERLKQQKAQLEQQRNAVRDEKTAGELERKLAQVENELRQKDNDTYRRSHMTVYEV